MKSGVSVEIIYFHTLKPFDSKTLVESIKKTRKLVSLEELSAHDGLFNLCIKSILGLNDISVKQIAINDFVHDYGSYEDLCSSQGLNHKNLYQEVLNLLRIN